MDEEEGKSGKKTSWRGAARMRCCHQQKIDEKIEILLHPALQMSGQLDMRSASASVRPPDLI